MDTTTVHICNNCGKAGEEVSSKCSRCKSVFYCGRDCQLEDWRASHKRLCKQLNVGEAQQASHPDHSRIQEMQQGIYVALSSSPPNIQKFYKLFLSGDSSDATYNKMKKLLMKQPMWQREMIKFQSLSILMQSPKEMALLRTSPLQVALDCGCDPNYLSRPRPEFPRDNQGSTALHWLAEMADPNSYESHEIQVILGQQLLDAGANVNATTEIGLGKVTPLHRACHSAIVTNLSFIRLLLEHGADPNARSVPEGETPLMHTLECSMSAAKLLLSFPSLVDIDVNVRSANGSTFLGGVRSCIPKHAMMMNFARSKSEKMKCELRLKQFQEIEEILVSMGAIDGGWNDYVAWSPSAFPAEVEEEEEEEDTSVNSNTIKVLLDKDLKKDGPEWYKKLPFWIDDPLCMQRELFLKTEHLHSGYNNTTYDKGKKPVVGQAVQIAAKIPGIGKNMEAKGFRFGHLDGVVTEVLDAPTDEELASSGSYFYGKVSAKCDNMCIVDCIILLSFLSYFSLDL